MIIKHTTTITEVKIDHTKNCIHSPTWPPPEPPYPYCEFLGGSEGLIGPPLPRLQAKEVLVIEHLLYGRHNQYVRTTNRKTNMVNQTHLNIIYIKFCVLKSK